MRSPRVFVFCDHEYYSNKSAESKYIYTLIHEYVCHVLKINFLFTDSYELLCQNLKFAFFYFKLFFASPVRSMFRTLRPSSGDSKSACETGKVQQDAAAQGHVKQLMKPKNVFQVLR
jgi:hypothetical protein